MPECAQHKNATAAMAGADDTRYAIFFTPQPGTALAAFGRSWFGRAQDGSTAYAFSEPGLGSAGFAKLPVSPGRYHGLHAPFKLPFKLREAVDDKTLADRIQSFAESRHPVETGPLDLKREGRFLMLKPRRDPPPLSWLAAQCLSAFDDLAEGLDQNDREERSRPQLDRYQRLLLESFGDANVMSEFRFGFRLAGPLAPVRIEQVAEALWPVLQQLCEDGITIDALSLLGHPGGRAPLRLIARYPLAG